MIRCSSAGAGRGASGAVKNECAQDRPPVGTYDTPYALKHDSGIRM